jgi:NAD(P)-dependent dehydrogenase (short-subunit alcohol dehydrogenase family)
VASDLRDLEAQRAHLRLVYDADVAILAADAIRSAECVTKISRAARALGSLDALFFPIGASRPDDVGLLPFSAAQELLSANLDVVIGVVSHFLPALLSRSQGTIVGFGSVAALRGRGANIVYSAAKRGLESYFESLRHLTAPAGINIQFYRLGYLATQQSFGKRLLLPATSPARVAKEVVKNLGRRWVAQYYPRYWSITALAVRALPWVVFRRIRS